MAAEIPGGGSALVCRSADGIVLQWSAEAERVFGFSANEMLGSAIWRIVPPERLQEEAGFLQRVRCGNGIGPVRTVRLRKDGSRVNVEVSLLPIRDEMNRVAGASQRFRVIRANKTQRRATNVLMTISEFGVDVHPAAHG